MNNDPNLLYLPDAIKALDKSIADREWERQPVQAAEYTRLAKWRGMVKDGVMYEPVF